MRLKRYISSAMAFKGFSIKSPPTLGPVFELSHSRLRLCDIGANIMDEMFYGEYNNKQQHESDVNQVVERAQSMGVASIIFTGSCVKNSAETLSFCNSFPSKSGLFCTAGIHPCSSKVFEQNGVEKTIEDLKKVLEEGLKAEKLVAFGECGLDYDRLHYCGVETQLLGFEKQLELAANYDLPLFLHNRNTGDDFLNMMRKFKSRLRGGGVVHSFTGSAAEMQALVDLGFYIGFNGCSLRTEEGLANAALVPDHLLLLETDAPWCGIKASHPSYKYVDTTFPTKKKEKFEEGIMVKDRNEPCTMVQVLEVVAKIRNRDPFELAEQVYENSETLFPLIKQL